MASSKSFLKYSTLLIITYVIFLVGRQIASRNNSFLLATSQSPWFNSSRHPLQFIFNSRGSQYAEIIFNTASNLAKSEAASKEDCTEQILKHSFSHANKRSQTQRGVTTKIAFSSPYQVHIQSFTITLHIDCQNLLHRVSKSCQGTPK